MLFRVSARLLAALSGVWLQCTTACLQHLWVPAWMIAQYTDCCKPSTPPPPPPPPPRLVPIVATLCGSRGMRVCVLMVWSEGCHHHHSAIYAYEIIQAPQICSHSIPFWASWPMMANIHMSGANMVPWWVHLKWNNLQVLKLTINYYFCIKKQNKLNQISNNLKF